MFNIKRSLILSAVCFTLLGSAVTTRAQFEPLAYGAAGLVASKLGKDFGKWTVEAQVGKSTKTPLGKAAQLDVKFAFLTLLKTYLGTWFPALAENAPKKSASLLAYKAGTKGLCIWEAVEKIEATYDAWEELYNTSNPHSSNKRGAVVSTQQEIFDAVNTLALFATSYIITQMSITSSEMFANQITQIRSGQYCCLSLPAPMPKIVSTTMGILVSAFVKDTLVMPAFRSGAELIGYNNSKAHKLQDAAYEAGMKGPFGWEGVMGTWEALEAWQPTITNAIASGCAAALVALKRPQGIGFTATLTAFIAYGIYRYQA